MSTILAFPRPSVRTQLVASHDMLDLGEAMCNAGHGLVQAGLEVMRLCEPPSEERLRHAETMASLMLQAVNAMRMKPVICVELPADCEPVA